MRYGLIGRSLGHSFSREYFTEKFAREGLPGYRYDNFELADVAELPQLLARHPELAGLNVTIPYKRAVLPYLTRVDATAAELGAVNTIVRQASGDLVGYNTDVIGFRQTLERLGIAGPAANSSVGDLILGTGGASDAVAYVLANLGRSFHFVSRSPSAGQLGYADVAGLARDDARLVVNATPVGTHPATEAMPPLPSGWLSGRHTVVDLIYNPPQTKLLRRAAEAGAQTANGLTMLHGQAEAAWSLWRGAAAAASHSPTGGASRR